MLTVGKLGRSFEVCIRPNELADAATLVLPTTSTMLLAAIHTVQTQIVFGL